MKPSEDFVDAFDDHSGGCRETCECGRVHFDSYNLWTWDEGELEGLKEKSTTDPEHYIEHDCAVGRYTVNGKTYVYHCVCGGGSDIEAFLNRDAAQIADYLNRRAKRMMDRANRAQEKETVQKSE